MSGRDRERRRHACAWAGRQHPRLTLAALDQLQEESGGV